MKKKVTGSLITAVALLGSIFIGGAPAYAATTSTIVVTGGNGVFGLDPAVVSGTANNAGTVAFSAAGKVIIGCESIATTLVAPFVAKCSWRPAASGPTVLTASFTPKDIANFTAVTSAPFTAKVGIPVQGVISPINIFVDTVLASGSTGALAPRFGVGCTVASEFIIGQTIVFRVYANNADQGGAVMDSSNTAKAFIQVAGITEPIQLAYGNHSGVAFWTGVLKTGSVAPAYGTLGLINFKITMVAKDSDTVKVLSTRSVIKKIDGVRVVENGKTVFERVPYFRTVKVSPILKGATGTWQSNFTAASQLTLYAIPKA
jgi:hypothetical protein